MVGTSPRKHKSNLQTSLGQDQSRLGKTATGRKIDKTSPLQNKIFYLDLKNPGIARNLQKSLQELGATVELFLVQEVNYVVTDRNQWLTGSGPNAPPPSPFAFASASPASSVTSVNSPSFNENNKRSKTRAECMLDKVRRQPQQYTLDPLDNARRWGISIHSYEKIAASVEKLLTRRQRAQPPTINIKGPYIKFETYRRDSRPGYGELGAWPSLNFTGSAGSCPFLEPATSVGDNKRCSNRSSHDEKRTAARRRSQPRMTRLAAVAGSTCASRPGNCELCNVRYTSLRRHLESDKHASASGCADNYATLDSLIARGPSMFDHEDTETNQRRSMRHCCQVMTPNPVNGLVTRRRKTGAGGARTRSMSGGQLYLPSGLLGTTAEDGGNPVRAAAHTAVGCKKSPEKSPEPDAARSPPPATECNGKLRRRRRLINRRSQLAVLSDEAQNFMFREATQRDSSTSSSSSSEAEEAPLESSGELRRKRRSQAEAFIADNREYYKFETPGSRLRFHEDKEVAETNGKVKCEEHGAAKKVSPSRRTISEVTDIENMDRDFKYSFENVPRSEPWYQTFRRQDDGEEFYFSLPNSDPPFLLPYELPPPRYPCFSGRGRRGRRRRGGLERKPRKSPRCHASTLAILSGFIQRRKKDPTKLKEAAIVVKEEPLPLPVINPPIRLESESEMRKLAASLDLAFDLSGDYDDLESGDLGDLCATPLVGSDPPLLDLLASECAACLAHCDLTAEPAAALVDNWRTRKKKKRKNLTGWPNAKRTKLVAFRAVKEECEDSNVEWSSQDETDSVGEKMASSSDDCPVVRATLTRKLRSAVPTGQQMGRRESPRKTVK